MSLLGNFNTQFSNIQRKSALASLGSVRTSHVTFSFGRNLGFCSLLVKLVLSLVKTVPREPRGLDHEQVTGDHSQLVNLGLKNRTRSNALDSVQLGERTLYWGRG